MQSANLFGAPLGVSSVICPSRATQASGLAGGPDYNNSYRVHTMVLRYAKIRYNNSDILYEEFFEC